MNHNYDITFLDTVNEFYAYFLGLFVADGHICHTTKRIEIGLADKQLIDDLMTYMSYKSKPYIKCNDRVNPLYRIRISGRPYDIVKSFGFTSNKLGSECIPSTINDEMFPHFLRGFSDGDGSFFFTGAYNNLTWNLTSANKSFLQIIQTKLKQLKIIHSRADRIYKLGKQNCYQFHCSNSNGISVGHFLYKNSNIELTRKRAKWESALLQNKRSVWTDEEFDMAANLIVPPGRSRSEMHDARKRLRKWNLLVS